MANYFEKYAGVGKQDSVFSDDEEDQPQTNYFEKYAAESPLIAQPEKPEPVAEPKSFMQESVIDQLYASWHEYRASKAGEELVDKAGKHIQAEKDKAKGVTKISDVPIRGLNIYAPGVDPKQTEKSRAELQRIIDKRLKHKGDAEAIPYSPETLAFIDENSKTPMWEAFKKAPGKIIVELAARSGAHSAAALAPAVAGGAVGGPAGFAAGMGVGSYKVQYANSLLENLEKKGVDLTSVDSVLAAVANEELMREVETMAAKESIMVAGPDVIGALVGAKMITPAIKNAILREVTNAAAQAPIQAVTGMVGEAGRQLVTNEDFKPREIMAEGVAEFATAPIEVGAAALSGARKHGEDTLESLLKSAGKGYHTGPGESSPPALGLPTDPTDPGSGGGGGTPTKELGPLESVQEEIAKLEDLIRQDEEETLAQAGDAAREAVAAEGGDALAQELAATGETEAGTELLIQSRAGRSTIYKDTLVKAAQAASAAPAGADEPVTMQPAATGTPDFEIPAAPVTPVGEVTPEGETVEAHTVVHELPATLHQRDHVPPHLAYGSFANTKGADTQEIDFIQQREDSGSGRIFVVDHMKKDEEGGGFEQHKVMVGFPNQMSARRAHREVYPKNKAGAITEMKPDQFREWVSQPQNAPVSQNLVQPESEETVETKPVVAETKPVQYAEMQPGQQVTLYRGENAENEKGGAWWTTDKTKAEKFGKVTEVTLPSETVGKYAAQGHGGGDEFVFLTEGKRPLDLIKVVEPKVHRTTMAEIAAEADQRNKDRAERAAAAKPEPAKTDIEVESFTKSKAMTPMAAKRATQTLNASITTGGKTHTRRELVEKDVAEGRTVVVAAHGKRRLQHPDGRYRDESQISKTAMDYAEYLIAQKAKSVEKKPELFITWDGQRHPVASIEEAQDKWNQFRDESDAGASEIGSAQVADATGKVQGKISYNGKYWPAEGGTPRPEPAKKTKKEVQVQGFETDEELSKSPSKKKAPAKKKTSKKPRYKLADTFYSTLHQTVQRAEGMPKKAAASEFKQWLDGQQRKGNIKQEERDWMGVDAWLAEHKGPVTREELQAFVNENQVTVKEKLLGQRIKEEKDVQYEQYTTPGGKNYRELLLTLPEQNNSYRVVQHPSDRSKWAIQKPDGSYIRNDTDTDRPGAIREWDNEEYARKYGIPFHDKQSFRSGHFNEPNILAHVRFNERTDADGKRILFLEEIQSDWHQQGRKKGYKNPRYKEMAADWSRRSNAGEKFTEAEIDAMNEAHDAENYGAPDAPFKKSWPMLAVKRMIRWAAENNFDAIAWTTGEQQADRYDMSKQIEDIGYEKRGENFNVTVWDKRGDVVWQNQSATPELVEDTLGKEILKKMQNGEGHEERGLRYLTGLDLKVGGEGMRGFYDDILPAEVNKYVKRWGGKVGETSFDLEVTVPEARRRGIPVTTKKALTAPTKVHSLTITPRMKASVLEEGQPLFRKSEATTGKSLTRSQATEILQPLLDRLPGLKLKILNSPREAPGRIRAMMKADGRLDAPGIFDTETGEIYIFSENNTNADELIETALHEGVGHLGLRALALDEASFDALMDDIYANAENKAALQAVADAYGLDPESVEDQRIIADEYAAQLAQTEPKAPLLRRVIDWIRNILRSLGTVKRWTDNDILALLRKSRAKLARAPKPRVRSVAGTAAGARYQSVYHGSPHKWDLVDLSKVGTGEGAQAFGWGFYAAESPGVAKGYKRTTSYQDAKRQFLDELPENAEIEEVEEMLADGGFSPEKREVLEALKENDWLGFDYPAQAISAAFSKSINNWDPSPRLKSAVENYGHLYELDLPDSTIEKMLDWDKPLSEQPEILKVLLPELKSERPDFKIESLTGQDAYKRLAIRRSKPEPAPNWTSVSNDTEDRAWSGERATSQYLNSIGIPGIKYLDGTSRGGKKAYMVKVTQHPDDGGYVEYIDYLSEKEARAAVEEINQRDDVLDGTTPPAEYVERDGTRNFVVFDAKHLKTLTRNGEPVTLPEIAGEEQKKPEPMYRDKRARYILRKAGDQSPLGVATRLNATVESMLQNPTTVEKAKIAASKLDTAARRALFLTMPFQYFVDWVDNKVMPSLPRYMRFNKRMDGRRNELMLESGTIAQDWHKVISENANGLDRRWLGEIMQAATLLGIDVAEPYAPISKKLTDAAKVLDDHRRGTYAKLRKFWDRLSPEAQDIYRQVRDLHVSRRTQTMKLLENRINATDANLVSKRALIDELRTRFESATVRGVYFPLMRFGDHWAMAKDARSGELLAFSLLESARERDQWVEAWNKVTGVTATGGIKTRDDARTMLETVDPNFVAKVTKMIDDVMDPKDPAAQQLVDEIWQMFLSTLPEISMRKAFKHRQGTLGFSADQLKAFSSTMFHNSHQLARLEYVYQMEDALNSMRTEAKNLDASTHKDKEWAIPILEETLRRHAIAMRPPSRNKASTAATTLGFLFYLGITPAAGLVNFTQTLVMALPSLAAEFNILGAHVELARAMKQILFHGGGRRFANTLTGDELKAWNEASKIGAFDKTQVHDLAGLTEQGSAYSERTKQILDLISWIFHKVEQFNRQITFLAAYRLARRRGDKYDDAVQLAADLNEQSHFNYGINNRPRVMQGDWARVFFLFKQYSVHMTYRLTKDFLDSLPYRNLPKEQKKKARIRFAGIQMMTALLAGLTGMFLYGPIKAALQAAFDDDDDDPIDVEAALRNYIAESVDSAQIAEAIMKGPVNAYAGIDMSSRVSLNQLWFRDTAEDMDNVNAFRHYVMEALGPVVGIGNQYAQGLDDFAMDQEWRGMERFLPKFFKDLMKTWRFATEGATTYRGDVLVPAEDFSFLELAKQASGFAPSELTRQYEQNRVIKGIEGKILDRRTRLLDRLWLAWKRGDQEAHAKVHEEILQFNKTHEGRKFEGSRGEQSLTIDFDTRWNSIASRMRYSVMSKNGINIHPDLEYLLIKYDFVTQGKEKDVIDTEAKPEYLETEDGKRMDALDLE